MPGSDAPELKPLKFSIVMRWLSANNSIRLTANIRWFDWITTTHKPGDTPSVTGAIAKLSEFETKLVKGSTSTTQPKPRSIPGLRTMVANIPIFKIEGPSRNQNLRVLNSVVDDDTGITITFEEVKQILDGVARSTARSISVKDVIDSYDRAGKWIESISPDVRCYYNNPDATTPKGSDDTGMVAVADAFSSLVAPYSDKFGYKITDESKVEELYNRLLKFRKTDEVGEGFLPGADVPLCGVPIVESTALAVIALCDYYAYLVAMGKTKESDVVERDIKPAVEWLKNNQFDEGYWSTYKSESYKSYPNVQATQFALMAMGLDPVSKIIGTEECIEKSISYLQDRMIDSGWGADFIKDQYDLIATTRILTTLLILPDKHGLNELIESVMQKFKSNLKATKKFHSEEIYIPKLDSTHARTRSSSTWYIPVKPFIITALLRYYNYMKRGSIDEDMEKFIQDGILEIVLSQEEFGGWLGTEDGITEIPSTSSTAFHAGAIIQKAMQEYTYLKSALKVRE